MIAKKHFILLFMLLAYVIPISYVYFIYQKDNHSVSQIICSDSCQHMILFSMMVMGWFTLLYEWERMDPISLRYIALLLIGLYGLLWFDESYSIHYVCATFVFIAIIGFMFHHRNRGTVFMILFLLQLFLSGLLLYHMSSDIFIPEVLLITNFAVYYLCLHFIQS